METAFNALYAYLKKRLLNDLLIAVILYVIGTYLMLQEIAFYNKVAIIFLFILVGCGMAYSFNIIYCLRCNKFEYFTGHVVEVRKSLRGDATGFGKSRRFYLKVRVDTSDRYFQTIQHAIDLKGFLHEGDLGYCFAVGFSRYFVKEHIHGTGIKEADKVL